MPPPNRPAAFASSVVCVSANGAYASVYRRICAQDDVIHSERAALSGEIGINTAAVLCRVALDAHVAQLQLACAFDIQPTAADDADGAGQRLAVANGQAAQSDQ